VVVVVTGGVGSGKSTVASLLAEAGFALVDADREVSALYEKGSPFLALLAESFGSDIITPSGELDRAALAARVFADEQARRRLNALIHPAVMERISRKVRNLLEAGQDVVVEIPLLAELVPSRQALSVMPFPVDSVVVVVADQQTRLARLRERGMEEDDALARMKSQASDEARLRLADYVIYNDDDLGSLKERVAALAAALRAGA
jgi:dephospho-CoA kinase